MATSIGQARQSMEVNSLDRVGPARMVKAELGCPLGLVVRDGLIRACGSLKAAAIAMGIDQGQLSRDLFSGAFKLERLARLSATDRAVVIEAMHVAVAPLSTPKARLREINRQRRQLDEEAEQIIDGLAS